MNITEFKKAVNLRPNSIYFFHLCNKLLGSFFNITAIFCLVMCAIQSVIMLEALSSYSVDFINYCKAILYVTPYIFFNIIPIAFVTSYILLLKELRKSKTLTALANLGLSLKQISKAFLIVTLIAMTLHYIITLWVMPYSHHKFKNLKFAIENAQMLDMLKNKTFLNTDNGLTIYIEKSNKNELKGIFINDSREKDKQSTIIAEMGNLERQHNGIIKLVLHNGSLYTFDQISQKYNSMQFGKYIVDLKDETKIISIHSREIDYKELTILEILTKIRESTEAKASNAGIISLTHRITWPLYSLVLYWVCSSIMLGRYTYSREKSSKLSGIAGGICVIIIVVNFLIQSLSSQNIYVLFLLLLLMILPLIDWQKTLKHK